MKTFNFYTTLCGQTIAETKQFETENEAVKYGYSKGYSSYLEIE